jgi:hypothetical protein
MQAGAVLQAGILRGQGAKIKSTQPTPALLLGRRNYVNRLIFLAL